eukprot:8156601-Pyramimonas_sp.AAC.1
MEAETTSDSRATGSEEAVPPPPELDSYMADLGDSLELPEQGVDALLMTQEEQDLGGKEVLMIFAAVVEDR